MFVCLLSVVSFVLFICGLNIDLWVIDLCLCFLELVRCLEFVFDLRLIVCLLVCWTYGLFLFHSTL